MKVITIDDFSGGRNTLDSQLLVQQNQCIVSSQNVWAPQMALVKTPGTTLLYTLTATAGNIRSMYQDESVSTAQQLYYRINPLTGGYAVTDLFPYGGEAIVSALGYTTGTMSLKNGSGSATGNGTLWLSSFASGGTFRRFTVDNGTTWYQVTTVDDETHLVFNGSFGSNSTSSYILQQSIGDYNPAWASLAGNVLCVSTASYVQQFDGSGIIISSGTPKAAYLAVFKNYAFALKTAAFTSRLVWSAVKDPTSWPANNFIDIDKDRGTAAGLFPFGNELIIFKSRSMHKVIGDVFDPSNPTYSVYPISVPSSFQFGSGFSPTIHNGLLYFVCRNGLFVYRSGTTFITEVSTKFSSDMPDTFATTSVSGLTSLSFSESIFGISTNGVLLYRGLRYIATGSVTPAPRVGIMDQRGAWWTASDATGAGADGQVAQGQGSNWAILTSASWARPKVLFSPADGHVYSYEINPYFTSAPVTSQYNDNNAATVAIQAKWFSKEFNIDYGLFHKIIVYLKKQTAGTLSVDWSIDQATFTTNSVDMTVGRGQMIRAVLNVNQKGSTIQLRLTNSTVAQDFAIYAIKIFYTPSEDERLL